MGNTTETISKIDSSNQSWAITSDSNQRNKSRTQDTYSHPQNPKRADPSHGCSLSAINPLHIKASQSWVSCCLVSPHLAIASPLYLTDKEGNFTSDCEIVVTGSQARLSVCDVITIVPNRLGLLVLAQPAYHLPCMQISSGPCPELHCAPMKTVNFPEKVFVGDEVQYRRRIADVKFQRGCQPNKFSNFAFVGSLIVQQIRCVMNVVGLQVSEREALIFDKKICAKIQKHVKRHELQTRDQHRPPTLPRKENPNGQTIQNLLSCI